MFDLGLGTGTGGGGYGIGTPLEIYCEHGRIRE